MAAKDLKGIASEWKLTTSKMAYHPTHGYVTLSNYDGVRFYGDTYGFSTGVFTPNFPYVGAGSNPSPTVEDNNTIIDNLISILNRLRTG